MWSWPLVGVPIAVENAPRKRSQRPLELQLPLARRTYITTCRAMIADRFQG